MLLFQLLTRLQDLAAESQELAYMLAMLEPAVNRFNGLQVVAAMLRGPFSNMMDSRLHNSCVSLQVLLSFVKEVAERSTYSFSCLSASFYFPASL